MARQEVLDDLDRVCIRPFVHRDEIGYFHRQDLEPNRREMPKAKVIDVSCLGQDDPAGWALAGPPAFFNGRLRIGLLDRLLSVGIRACSVSGSTGLTKWISKPASWLQKMLSC